jgi:hypothetical protein
VTDERYPRGTAYHEAGHAVVAWSLGLEVGPINVLEEDASGGAQIGSADHLGLVEQIAVCAAGYTAENTFDHRTHYWAAAKDYDRIRNLLQANAIEEGPAAVAMRQQGYDCAHARLLAHEARVIRIAERLVQDGSIDAAEFLRLMDLP